MSKDRQNVLADPCRKLTLQLNLHFGILMCHRSYGNLDNAGILSVNFHMEGYTACGAFFMLSRE